jgi:hypothetical protein
MNNLEEFIKNNRAEFDHKEPREKLWSRIESDLDGSPPNFGWIWKAAAVVLLAACSYLIWERSQVQVPDPVASVDLLVDPEFVETELYYTQLIAEQRRMVEQFDLDDPELKEDFRRDLSTLDTAYQDLQQEYVDTRHETVLEAMIDNLQLRMELLNQQLVILEQIKNDYKDETEQIENI